MTSSLERVKDPTSGCSLLCPCTPYYARRSARKQNVPQRTQPRSPDRSCPPRSPRCVSPPSSSVGLDHLVVTDGRGISRYNAWLDWIRTDNFLSPIDRATVPRSFATFTPRLAGKPVEEQSAQHPGKSDVPHLENPTLSEEAVHADLLDVDPLAGKHHHGSSTSSSATGTAEKVVDQVKDAASKVAEKVKDAASTVTGAGNPQKRSYHSSAIRRAPENPEGSKPVEEQSAQHPGKSGIDHLENPSMSEEHVHADRTAHDPLPGDKKPSRQDNKAPNKNNVSRPPLGGGGGQVEPAGKPATASVDDLPDGEANKKSIESASYFRSVLSSPPFLPERLFSERLASVSVTFLY